MPKNDIDRALDRAMMKKGGRRIAEADGDGRADGEGDEIDYGSLPSFGFAIATSSQDVIEDNAISRGYDETDIEMDDAFWEQIGKDIDAIERNIEKWLKEKGFRTLFTGHFSDGANGGTIWAESPEAVALVKDYIETGSDEPYRTSSGTMPAGLDPYEGTGDYGHLIDVDLEFFDLDEIKAALGINESSRRRPASRRRVSEANGRAAKLKAHRERTAYPEIERMIDDILQTEGVQPNRRK